MRDFLLRNFWLKLTSLVLATLIWLTVQATLDRETRAAYQTEDSADALGGLTITERYFELPVQVGANGTNEDLTVWVTSPQLIHVTVSGERNKIRDLSEGNLQAFIDLAGRPAVQSSVYPVQVLTPPTVHCIRIVPPLVLLTSR